MNSAVATQSFRATASITPLEPLASITAGLVAVAVVMSWRMSATPDLLLSAAPGALAAGVALGLDDEGFRFIRTMPTPPLARLALRLTLLLPVLVVSTTSLLVFERVLFDHPGITPSASALGALVAAGIAIDVVVSRYRPESAAELAAGAVVAWAVADSLVPNMVGVKTLAGAWHNDALAVLAASIVIAIFGSAGREA